MAEFNEAQRKELTELIVKQKSTRFDNIVIELVKIVPSMLWVFAAIVVGILLYQPLIDIAKSNQIKKVAIGVFQLELFGAVGPDGTVKVTQEKLRPLDERAGRMISKLQGARILWVDDKNPTQNARERKALEALSVVFDLANTTKAAMQFVKLNDYDVIITDMKREGDGDGYCQIEELKQAGCDLLNKLHEEFKIEMPPTIVYAAGYNPAHGTPPFSFGMTNEVDELMQLVFDGLERRKSK